MTVTVESQAKVQNNQNSRKKALAVALDLESRSARRLGNWLAPEVGYLKIGLSLFCSEGPPIVRDLQRAGARIFLDLKFHDIPNTVALASRAVASLGIDLMTVHASGGEAMIKACVEGAVEGARLAGVAPPTVLAVTILTSLDDAALGKIGISGNPAQAVERLAKLAIQAGAGGIVCSPKEIAAVRSAVGASPLIVTPGIRPSGGDNADQARTETPEAAIAAGADVLVVGRPILQASDPISAARAMSASVSAAEK